MAHQYSKQELMHARTSLARALGRQVPNRIWELLCKDRYPQMFLAEGGDIDELVDRVATLEATLLKPRMAPRRRPRRGDAIDDVSRGLAEAASKDPEVVAFRAERLPN